MTPSSFCRFYTMSIMMAVDLLGCTGSTEERAALLHKTIQLAAELKSNLGNMFGFAAVMRALELPQVKTDNNFVEVFKFLTYHFILIDADFFTYLLYLDFSPGADVGDFTPETYRGRHLVWEEAQAVHEKHERRQRCDGALGFCPVIDILCLLGKTKTETSWIFVKWIFFKLCLSVDFPLTSVKLMWG